jgi:hypothetical protein
MSTVRRREGLIPPHLDLGELPDSAPDSGRTRRMHVVRSQLEHLFPPAPFQVNLAYGPVPEGFREVEAWRVIPGRSAPRYLLPVDVASAAQVIVSHNGLRSTRLAGARRLAAAAIPMLAAVHRSRSVLRLSVPAAISDEDVDAVVITRHLRRHAPGAVATAVSLRDFHARAKPTVQLVDAHGHVVAFAKVASDEATGERVLTEADLLERFGEGLQEPGSPVRLPAVLAAGRCGPFAYSVVEPLPPQARRLDEDDEAITLRALVSLGECLGPIRTMPMAQTALWDDVMARVEAGRAVRGVRPDLVAGLDRLVASAHRADAGVPVPVGACHGDWTPWNMGLVSAPSAGGRGASDTVWVWDLEYGTPQGPLGLDALRWVFQVHHAAGDATFGEAVAAMTADAPRLLTTLGIAPALAPTLVRFHVIETMAGALGLLAAGRGLPAGLDPDAVAVMRSLEVPLAPPAPRRGGS